MLRLIKEFNRDKSKSRDRNRNQYQNQYQERNRKIMDIVLITKWI